MNRCILSGAATLGFSVGVVCFAVSNKTGEDCMSCLPCASGCMPLVMVVFLAMKTNCLIANSGPTFARVTRACFPSELDLREVVAQMSASWWPRIFFFG